MISPWWREGGRVLLTVPPLEGFDYVPGGGEASLCEPLEALEGVVDEDPVLVWGHQLLLLHRRPSWKKIVYFKEVERKWNVKASIHPEGTFINIGFLAQHRCFHQKPGFFNKSFPLIGWVCLTDLWMDQWDHGFIEKPGFLMKTQVVGSTPMFRNVRFAKWNNKNPGHLWKQFACKNNCETDLQSTRRGSPKYVLLSGQLTAASQSGKLENIHKYP